MSRRRRIYEGKAKVIYEGTEPGTLVQYFKDDSSHDASGDIATITGKGVLNNRISEHLMTRLAEIGVPPHLVRRRFSGQAPRYGRRHRAAARDCRILLQIR